MKRSAFTMVELIFVIVIIGILVAAAIPNFGNSENRAKISSEIGSMNSLDSAMLAASKFHQADFGDLKVNWHNYPEMNDTTTSIAALRTHYKNINKESLVLSKVVKKSESLKIVGYYPVIDCKGRRTWDDALYCDVLLLESTASDSLLGAEYPAQAVNNDTAGKPDKNDFWIFNPTARDINISTTNADTPINPVVVKSGELQLVDVNGTDPLIAINRVGLSGFVGNNHKYGFYNVQ